MSSVLSTYIRSEDRTSTRIQGDFLFDYWPEPSYTEFMQGTVPQPAEWHRKWKT